MRAATARAVGAPQTGERGGRFWEGVRPAVPRDAWVREGRARPHPPARRATLLCSATAIACRAPWRPGDGLGRQPRRQCPAGRGEEPPPEAHAGVAWRGLGAASIARLEQARAGALPSASRWLSAALPHALTQGVGAARRQRATAAGLGAALALQRVGAWRLLDRRAHGRRTPAPPAAAAGCEPRARAVLRPRTGSKSRPVRAVACARGRLGGPLHRQSDGLPGWATLWRGMQTLRLLAEGVRLARTLKRCMS